jgi:hypothetical protein
VHDLKALYLKAFEVQARNATELLESATPESEEEGDGRVIDIEPEGTTLPAPLSVVEELPSRLLAPSLTNQDIAEGLDQPETARQNALQADKYEWMCLPGHFGKARRIRVRVR